MLWLYKRYKKYFHKHINLPGKWQFNVIIIVLYIKETPCDGSKWHTAMSRMRIAWVDFFLSRRPAVLGEQETLGRNPCQTDAATTVEHLQWTKKLTSSSLWQKIFVYIMNIVGTSISIIVFIPYYIILHTCG